MARDRVILLSLVSLLSGHILSSEGQESGDDEGIFTSNVDLQRLLRTEETIVRELHSYIKDEEQRIDKLKKYDIQKKMPFDEKSNCFGISLFFQIC